MIVDYYIYTSFDVHFFISIVHRYFSMNSSREKITRLRDQRPFRKAQMKNMLNTNYSLHSSISENTYNCRKM